MPTRPDELRRVCAAWLLVALLVLAPVTARAEAGYRYRDGQGQWVYTDRPSAHRPAAGLGLPGASSLSPQWLVVPRSIAGGIALVAVNPCACYVEFAVQAETAHGVLHGRGVVGPESEAPLLDVATTDGPSAVRYAYGYVVGAPNAEHRPPRPYRAPFALARQFTVTQAPPDAITHVDAASRNAIDIAMPVGTAVHAAREGLVINVARTHFRSGLQASAMGEANFVQVLHDDGTYALYAHLQMDSVRVRPGQRIARGEYLANSGNTGFTSGPHLHFVVLRNAGLRTESVPVQFAGRSGAAVVAHSGQALQAH